MRIPWLSPLGDWECRCGSGANSTIPDTCPDCGFELRKYYGIPPQTPLTGPPITAKEGS